MSNIILITGTYDLIKDHVRRRKVSLPEEEILLNELKNAQQVLRCEITKDIVCVNSVVTFKNQLTNEDKTVTFVGFDKSKPIKNKISILAMKVLLWLDIKWAILLSGHR